MPSSSRFTTRPIMPTLLTAASLLCIASNNSYAADNGSQLNEKFRINYAGYLPQAAKTALYLGPNKGELAWVLKTEKGNCAGQTNNYVSNDKSSGDSFYIIDFSTCTTPVTNAILQVGTDTSLPFEISNNPYGNLKYEFFDFFKDHEGKATFNQAINNWAKDLSITFNYVKDAGDNGVYPTNTAEASWALINTLETYPSINTYYSANWPGARTVYEQLLILTEQFNYVFNHPKALAIPKFHTNVNKTWAVCAPHTSGTCISEPETKATFATARTLAAMARLHATYGTPELALRTYQQAQAAMNAAQKNPLVCLQANAFGGEGGMYPDNDVASLKRNPQQNLDNCAPHKNNTQDDEYTAQVELYLSAVTLNQTADIDTYKNTVIANPRFNEVSSYFWGAVATEGNLSLLTHEKNHTINLDTIKQNLIKKADEILNHQTKGYPGVTWDANSTQWNNGDQDDKDNNVRWGSHRNALNDGRLLIAAAEVAKAQNNNAQAAAYARSAIKTLDHISGINAVNLAMFTANGYPHIEHAVRRTHDGADPKNKLPGKLVLGPNNWTNAGDGDMPKFGSKPGLKMFALTGTGWASREISIDGNASLIPVAYFALETAPAILALSPITTTPLTNNAATTKTTTPATGQKTGGSLNWGFLLLLGTLASALKQMARFTAALHAKH